MRESLERLRFMRASFRLALVVMAGAVYLAVGAIVIEDRNTSSSASSSYALLRAVADAGNTGRSICGLPALKLTTSVAPPASAELASIQVTPRLTACLHRHGYLTSAEAADINRSYSTDHSGSWSWGEIALYIGGLVAIVSGLAYLMFRLGRRPT